MYESYKRISFWLKFVGLFNILTGAVAAFFGFFVFVIGAIPGLFTIFIGVKLLNASKYASFLANNPVSRVDIEDFVSNLYVYFLIQGLVIVLGIVVTVFGLFIG